MRADPVEVAVLIAGIDHQQIATIRYRIDKDVVDDATVVIA